ncbi:hypothetical protein [Flavisphingomonas formosensis]|uniref:hypothetical protein n=1 Tax=Flavisphingomonas formosensis TaxID=861534 RepID=UPI0012F7085E|nr:hypothetical protein [Sphingomonas formosensis]
MHRKTIYASYRIYTVLLIVRTPVILIVRFLDRRDHMQIWMPSDKNLQEWTLAELYAALDLIDDLIGPQAMSIAGEIDRRARPKSRRSLSSKLTSRPWHPDWT